MILVLKLSGVSGNDVVKVRSWYVLSAIIVKYFMTRYEAISFACSRHFLLSAWFLTSFKQRSIAKQVLPVVIFTWHGQLSSGAKI